MTREIHFRQQCTVTETCTGRLSHLTILSCTLGNVVVILRTGSGDILQVFHELSHLLPNSLHYILQTNRGRHQENSRRLPRGFKE